MHTYMKFQIVRMHAIESSKNEIENKSLNILNNLLQIFFFFERVKVGWVFMERVWQIMQHVVCRTTLAIFDK